MKMQSIAGIPVSQIILGHMRLPSLSAAEQQQLLTVAVDNGINFFDHADIYGGGQAEADFGVAARSLGWNREDIVIQSKCGIRDGFFDSSKEHILRSVDEILKRLQTDYLDILLLHRADALAQPEEIAEAFTTLKDAGKVKAFGVSNHTVQQIELLNHYLSSPLVVNQVQFSLAHAPIVDAGIYYNTDPVSPITDDGMLPFSQRSGITLQAWSPFQYGFFEGVFLGNEKFVALNEAIDQLAEKYDATPNAIATAWILRHPAQIQVISGTMNVDRLVGITKAVDITLTREEWYDLYQKAGRKLP